MTETHWSPTRRAAFEAWRSRRFWSRVDSSGGPGACWPWTGPRMWNGYGRATLDDRVQNAHRVAWRLARGPIADGLHVDHLCRVKLCCNPSHLEPVTVRENLYRSPSMIARVNKTHCPAGHPYGGANLYLWRGERQCRICRTAAAMRSQRKRRAA